MMTRWAWSRLEKKRGYRFCSECKSCYEDSWDDEGIEPAKAEFKITGSAYADSTDWDRRIPVNKLVCDGHYEIILADRDFKGKAIPV
jgi:hypothetical protein